MLVDYAKLQHVFDLTPVSKPHVAGATMWCAQQHQPVFASIHEVSEEP